MKILLDENLPHYLAQILPDYNIEIKHVYDFDLGYSKDTKIWDFAKNNNFVIVTKDKDFARLSHTHGHPPKVVSLKIGNTSIEMLKQIFIQNEAVFKDFIASDTESIIVLHKK
jgi:predicted nuclease of predicted toxin-antitoxin system